MNLEFGVQKRELVPRQNQGSIANPVQLFRGAMAVSEGYSRARRENPVGHQSMPHPGQVTVCLLLSPRTTYSMIA
jgi:hypothetical protein